MDRSDSDLIKEVKSNNCEDSLKKLISRHSSLCYKIYFKYSSTLSKCGIDFEEALKEKDYVLWKSIQTYDPERKTKFSTWLGNFTRYHCLNLINQKKHTISLDIDEIRHCIDKKAAEEATGYEELREFKDFCMNILSQVKDKRIKKIFELRYFSGEAKLTWNKISDSLGISIQTAINLHERGRKILRKKVSSENLEDFV